VSLGEKSRVAAMGTLLPVGNGCFREAEFLRLLSGGESR